MKSKYIQLYNKLLNQIEVGKINTGENLPSEKELMEKYQMSRDTVRKSLNLLVQKGYIEKSKGKLAKVINKNQFKFPISAIKSFKELHIGIENKTYVDNLEIVKGENEIMEKLNLEKNEEYFKVVRIREIEGEKIIIDKDYIPRKFVTNLPLKAVQNSLYEYLEKELGLKISYCTKEITVEKINDEDIKLLDLKNEFSMIVIIKSYTYLENGELFQYTEARHRPDKFKFIGYAYRDNL
ncbi:trehalose operon repressor [Fusobacterium sp. SYSU M8A802]